jgi:hypothetical protein
MYRVAAARTVQEVVMNPILTQLLADAHMSDMRAEVAVARRARQARRARRGPVAVTTSVRIAAAPAASVTG